MDKKLKELLERQAQLKRAGQAKAKKHDELEAAENRSAEQDAELAKLADEVNQIAADINAVNEDIKAAEAKRERDRLFASTAIAGVAAAGSLIVPHGAAARSHDPDPVRMGGFHSAAEFASAVRTAALGGRVDDRLLATTPSPDNTHVTGGPDGEGYLVPADIRDAIWEVVYGDPVVSRFEPEPTGSNRVEYGADESTPWGAAGVRAGWADELAQLTASKLATEGREVKLEKLYAFVQGSNEMLSDAPLLQSRLTRSAGQAISYKAVEGYMNGNGILKPLGYRQSKALIQIAKDNDQTAATVSALNIYNLMSRVFMGPRIFFMAGQDLMPQLAVMTVDTHLVWTAPSPEQFGAGIGGFINGIPVLFSHHAEKLGQPGDLSLINPDGYAAFMKRGGPEFAQSIHLWFDRDATAFRWTFRTGGQPHLSKPVSADKGKPSLSHFAEIAVRS